MIYRQVFGAYFLGHAPLIFSMADLWRDILVRSVDQYVWINAKVLYLFSIIPKIDASVETSC